MRHLEPLAVGSSLVTREYLAKGVTASIRSRSGRIIHVRGDTHVQIFARGTDHGWKDVPVPLRTDLDHLLGILFRDAAYEQTLDRIRDEYGGVQPFSTKSVIKEELVGRAPPNTPTKDLKIGPPTSGKSGGRAPQTTKEPAEEEVRTEEGEEKWPLRTESLTKTGSDTTSSTTIVSHRSIPTTNGTYSSASSPPDLLSLDDGRAESKQTSAKTYHTGGEE